MSTSTPPNPPTVAESIFSAWLSDRSRDFESVLRANSAHAAELRSLHAIWMRLEPMLVRAGIHPSDAAEQLKSAEVGDSPNLTPLDLGSRGGSSSNTTDLLRRLEAKRRAGRYRFDGEVARGGMGAILRVWDEDIRRHLAMKVVLGQAAGSQDAKSVDQRLVARFLEEAQVTGQLEHPGIVPVHELGLDAEGRVFFTMKLVKGRDLDAVYDLAREGREGWSETRALGVLLKVCEALAFAHAKDVIHRDLKPANVMVGDFGEVYVMDWGLARVLGRAEAHGAKSSEGSVRTERVEERNTTPTSSMMTMDGDVVGTPSYMPPEQARGDIDSLSARSDVYALGAMLYQLLAGSRPYILPGERVGGAEVWKRVLAGPPPAVESLAPRAPAELVAICEKAMERDPADRYADMLALANDLRAFLEGRVVDAFETGALAEARKWVRRNKPLAASLAAVVLALVAGLVTSLVLADRVQENADLAELRRTEAERNADEAKRNAEEAERNAEEAERNAEEAKTNALAAEQNAEEARRQARVAGEVNRFLNEDLLAAVTPDQLGINVTVREVLDQAAERLEGRFDDEPSIESALRLTIGESYAKLGEFAIAAPHLERALDLRLKHEGAGAVGTIDAMMDVASNKSDLSGHADAVELFRKAVAQAEESLGPEHQLSLAARNALGVELLRAGQTDEAREIYASLQPVQERVLGLDHENTMVTENNIALLDQEQGRFEEAAERYQRLLDRQRAVLGPRHPQVLNSMANLCVTLVDLGRLSEGEALGREALDLFREVKGADHPHTGRMATFLGRTLLRQGRPAEAEPLFAEALRIDIAELGEENATTQHTRGNLASAVGRLGRYEESVAMLRQALEVLRRVLPPDHRTTLEMENELAMTYLGMRKYPEAEALMRATLAGWIRAFGTDHPMTIMSKENLSNALFRQGQRAECIQILREVLDARIRVLGDDHADVARTMFNLAAVMQASGELGEARRHAEDAIARMRELGDDVERGLLSAVLQTLAELQSQAGDHAAAVDSYRGALEEERRSRGDARTEAFFLNEIGTKLVHLHEIPSALEALEEALALREKVFGPDADPTRSTLAWIGAALMELGAYEDAERVLLDLHERVLRAVGPDHAEALRARANLADAYERLGKPDEAAKWR